jgi:hypothetical protein
MTPDVNSNIFCYFIIDSYVFYVASSVFVRVIRFKILIPMLRNILLFQRDVLRQSDTDWYIISFSPIVTCLLEILLIPTLIMCVRELCDWKIKNSWYLLSNMVQVPKKRQMVENTFTHHPPNTMDDVKPRLPSTPPSQYPTNSTHINSIRFPPWY